jgi:curved DNA-binding protein
MPRMTDRTSVDVKTLELSPMANDSAVRQRLLSLFYTTRRKNMKQPGLGITTMEEMMKMPAGSLEFHLWYICEKGWIQREVSGPWSITFAGVDEIESRESDRARSAQRSAPRQ